MTLVLHSLARFILGHPVCAEYHDPLNHILYSSVKITLKLNLWRKINSPEKEKKEPSPTFPRM